MKNRRDNCSFCGRPAADVFTIVHFPQFSMCTECAIKLSQACDIVLKRMNSWVNSEEVNEVGPGLAFFYEWYDWFRERTCLEETGIRVKD